MLLGFFPLIGSWIIFYHTSLPRRYMLIATYVEARGKFGIPFSRFITVEWYFYVRIFP